MKTIDEAAKEYRMSKIDDPFTMPEAHIEAFKAGVEFAQKWIDVNDELPEKSCYVLVKKKDETIHIMSFHAPFDTGKRMFQWYGFGKWIDQHNKVTHWRPIELV